MFTGAGSTFWLREMGSTMVCSVVILSRTASFISASICRTGAIGAVGTLTCTVAFARGFCLSTIVVGTGLVITLALIRSVSEIGGLVVKKEGVI